MKREKFDGKSRPSTDLYRKDFDEIFKPKTYMKNLWKGFTKEEERN